MLFKIMEKPKTYSYIRFSSQNQVKGDSLKRQKDAFERYCKEKQLNPDDVVCLEEHGVSAFRGKHRKLGTTLGNFLELVKQDKIAKGSALVVENMDRLSREDVDTALKQFRGILKAGIQIITLNDGKKYTKENFNTSHQGFHTILQMSRAYKESAIKSERVSMAWATKRGKLAKGKILTRKVPLWIKVTKSGKFEIIEEVQKAVQYIFKRKLENVGKAKTMQELNQDKTMWKPPKARPSKIDPNRMDSRNKQGGWQEGTIQRILKNPEVYGEFQPCKMINGKRVPEGAPVQNYFPPVVSKATFLRAKELTERNKSIKGSNGGKTGKATNLFTAICKCCNCGATMHFIDIPIEVKGEPYLRCSNSRRKAGGCTEKPIQYQEFERIFFEKFDEIDLAGIKDAYAKFKACTNEAEQIGMRLQIRQEIQRVFEWIEIYPARPKAEYVGFSLGKSMQKNVASFQIDSPHIEKIKYSLRNNRKCTL
jgi:DNA invertase Pin-like site-specific DNA recombinase